MGGLYSKPEDTAEKMNAKAQKAAFNARESRIAAEAARRGEKYEKKKWVPPNMYDSRPSATEIVTKSKTERGHAVEFDAVPYEVDAERVHRMVRPMDYRAVELPPAEVEPQQQAHWRTEQARYREYEYPQHFVQSQNPNKEHREAENYRNRLIHDRDTIDRAQNRAGARYQEEQRRFNELTRQHRETQLADVNAMETLQAKKRESAEIERLEKQLWELKKGQKTIIEREKSEFESRFQYPDLVRERERLNQLHEEERLAHEEEERVEKSLKTVRSGRTPEEQRLQKISDDIDRLLREKEVCERKVVNLRGEETEKDRRRRLLKDRTEQLHREKLAAKEREKEKEKQAKEIRESEWRRREAELEAAVPTSPKLAAIKKQKERLQKDEANATRRKKEMEEALQAEEEALDATREMMKAELHSREELAKKKPVVSAREYQKQYTVKKEELESHARAQNAPIANEPHHERHDPVVVEKHKLETVKTTSAHGKGVPEAPPLSEKTTQSFVQQNKGGGGLKEEHFNTTLTPEGGTRNATLMQRNAERMS